MSEIAAVFAAGTLTALATGIGAVPVFWLGGGARRLRSALWGFAAGVMIVASVAGLLIPAAEQGSIVELATGVALGVGFLALARWVIGPDRGIHGAPARKGALVALVLFVHSFPEGLAIGTAWASDVAGLSAFVVMAIALQNVPEGTVTAIPLAEAGASHARQFWTAVLTSTPQPVGAVLALVLVEQVEALLPVSFAFAAGAMLALTARDLLPEACARPDRARGMLGIAVGALVMTWLAAALGV